MHISNEITTGMIISWILIVIVIPVTFALIKYTLKRELDLKISKEDHLKNAHKGLLSAQTHAEHCQNIVKELISSRKTDIKDALDSHSKILDEKFIALNKHIELSVTKTIIGILREK